ncbi:hypothetical protein C8J57DRAFT_1706418 [Mycena rebaudengoi]|nr:hypothetical protein C8J57DRAFT_1706418 [Mycena rebaudengoi]
MATPAATTLALANPNPKSPDAKPRKGTIQPCAPHIVKPALAIDSECQQTPHACAINLSYDFDFAADRGSAARRDLNTSSIRRFNTLDRRGPPLLVYATLPAYLRRTPVHLVHALHDAQMHLRARREARTVDISRGSAARVGARKADTDAEYDAWAEVLLDTVAADVKAGSAPRLGVLRFGTHNWASCEKIFAGVVHPDQPLADLGRGSLCAS